MKTNYLSGKTHIVFIIWSLILLLTDAKGFSGPKGGSSFKIGSKGPGTFAGPSSFNRVNNYRPANGPRRGSSFKSNAVSFLAGAAGGAAAYSLMKSMASSYSAQPGYYNPGYGIGETCVNNEDINGTVFGTFRCPLNGFPQEAKHCCGELGKQYCCIREGYNPFLPKTSSFGWIILAIIMILVIILVCVRFHRRRGKDVIMVPSEPPPMNREYSSQPFYNPSQPPRNENPYGVPPQNPSGNFNPYVQQPYTPYPPEQQKPLNSY